MIRTISCALPASPMRASLALLSTLFLLLAALVTSAAAQSAENVAVVINDESADSTRIGERYIERRGIPATNIIHIRTAPQEAITRAAYSATVEAPIRAALVRNALHDRILYIVLTKGVPLRITGAGGATTASVDSELTLLYRRMVGIRVADGGRIRNPYFEDGPIASAERFSHRRHDIYLVTRLDGFTVDDALQLIDRAQTPSKGGRFVLDQRNSVLGNPAGDLWLAAAAQRLAALGHKQRVLLEVTRAVARKVDNVLGYYSWGSGDPQNRARRSEMSFVPGALAATFASSNARTFQEPPADWMPTGNWQDKRTWFEGAPESLIGDLIRDGATGATGYVADPLLQSIVRPEILFPAYASGFNLAEAFYLATPHLGWQGVVIGDPLCTSAPRTTMTREEIEEPPSADTEMPRLFSDRRRQALQAELKTIAPEAVTGLMLAEMRLGRADIAGARTALEQTTEIAPDFVPAQLQLAMLYDQHGDPLLALNRYEQVVSRDPRNVIALNNLAYGIAVHRNAPAEAKPFAIKAQAIAPRLPAVIDTLAWIEYLLGNHAAAAQLIATAVRGAPQNADIRLHAAFIFASTRKPELAVTELDAALTLDPELKKRADVVELERRLRKP